jgi:hypothetical protein
MGRTCKQIHIYFVRPGKTHRDINRYERNDEPGNPWEPIRFRSYGAIGNFCVRGYKDFAPTEHVPSP